MVNSRIKNDELQPKYDSDSNYGSGMVVVVPEDKVVANPEYYPTLSCWHSSTLKLVNPEYKIFACILTP